MKKETKASAFKMPSVMSKKAHEKKRLSTLMGASMTCHESGKRMPKEWIKEILELDEKLAK